MRDDEKAILREALIEAARLGYRPARRKKHRNPLYRTPSKASSTWSHLYGNCRALAEWATDDNINAAVIGLRERSDNQSANIHAVRKAAEILNLVLVRIKA